MENVPVEHWAHALWRMAHVEASALPSGVLTEPLKQAILAFTYSQCQLIPCETCRDHFNVFIQSFPPSFGTGEDVQLWWLRCHNYTNRLLGKAEWSLDQLKRLYPPDGQYPETGSNPQVGNFPVVPFRPKVIGTNNNFVDVSPTTPNLGMNNVKRDAKPQWNPVKKPPPQARSIPFRVPTVRTPTIHTTIMNPFRASSIPLTRVQKHISFQTQQWRAAVKKKTGSGIKKKKCGSCSKKRS